jgi:hypothetical protein
MKYAQIRVLRALIKDDDVWTSLTSKYAKWSEGEIAPDNEEEDEEEDKSNREIPTAELSPNEDVYRPFFMALMHQDYDACRMMMLSDEEIGAISKREAEIVNQIIDERHVLNFTTRITMAEPDRLKLN